MKLEERDWKHLSTLKPLALDRLCQRILSQVQDMAADAAKSPHERYLEVYRIVHDGDDDIATGFNDLRRSNAWLRLVAMRRLGLITDAEFEGFSEQTRRRLSDVAQTGDASQREEK